MEAKPKPQGAGWRCGALTRRGTPCQRRVATRYARCYVHRDASEAIPPAPPQVPAPEGGGTAGERSARTVVAVVNQMGATADPGEFLGETLELAGFWDRLEHVRTACRCAKAAFRILIKPDLEVFDVGASTGVDPAIVEHLIALLHRRGYPQVIVADGPGSADLWLENRDVPVLADLVGYRYVTEEGRPYEIVSLGDDVIAAGFPAESVLGTSGLGRAWVDAHFRISFAKNKTHEEYFFALGLHNLLGALPLRDKEYHYYHRLDPGEVGIALLRHTPVHFSLIDALVSNHGPDGPRSVTPLRTGTLIASEDLLLADWAAALKMGLDPYASPLNARALRTIGLPPRYRIEGDLQPYPGWKNVPLVVVDSVRRRNRSVALRQLVRPWFPAVNRELFPFRNAVDERMNRMLGDLLRQTDQHPLAHVTLVGVNYLLAACQHVLDSYVIMYDQDQVWRQQRMVGLDLARYDLSEYESIVAYLEPLAHIAAHTPPDRNGLRWRYLDQSVLFEFSRHLPMAFDEFVARVDISAAVRMMNDNIGGACVPVAADARGRPTHQAERNIYLPQPNWMALFGGTVIDVEKLEFIRYAEDRQQIFWRTVASANHSARFDDGLVTFARNAAGHTVITIVARQQFTLPLFWQVLNMDFLPQIKDSLVSDAYTTFFSRTLANFEAAFEGRAVGAGHPWNRNFGESGADPGQLPLEQLANLFVKLAGVLEPLVMTLLDSPTTASSEQGEQRGNRPIDAALNPVGTFLTDLFDAVKKDLDTLK